MSTTFKAGTQGGVGGPGTLHRTPTMMTLSPTRPTLAMSTPAQRDVMATPDSGGRRGDGVTRQTAARANALAVDEARRGFAATADAGSMRPIIAHNNPNPNPNPDPDPDPDPNPNPNPNCPDDHTYEHPHPHTYEYPLWRCSPQARCGRSPLPTP